MQSNNDNFDFTGYEVVPRCEDLPIEKTLTETEKTLLEMWRAIPPADRELVKAVLTTAFRRLPNTKVQRKHKIEVIPANRNHD